MIILAYLSFYWEISGKVNCKSVKGIFFFYQSKSLDRQLESFDTIISHYEDIKKELQRITSVQSQEAELALLNKRYATVSR